MQPNPKMCTRTLIMQLLMSLDDARTSIDDLGSAFQSDNPRRALAAQTRLYQAWGDAASAIRMLEQMSGCNEEDARRELRESYRRGRVLLVLAWNVISMLPVKRHLASRLYMRPRPMSLRGDPLLAVTTRSAGRMRERHPTIGSVDDILRRARASLVKLTSAIGQRDYFGSWLAAFQLRAALQRARSFIQSLPVNHRAPARVRLAGLESLACPMLELAPAPTRADVRALRVPNAHAEQRVWACLEERWRWTCCVLPTRFSHSHSR